MYHTSTGRFLVSQLRTSKRTEDDGPSVLSCKSWIARCGTRKIALGGDHPLVADGPDEKITATSTATANSEKTEEIDSEGKKVTFPSKELGCRRCFYL